ncbi:SDR family NAD(P)-dependent oxidoreductase [Streptantibioticus cattleyicolor]|uniref:Putative polyketide synthase n=1 Tax=Streptantibioticus cattleyicolor (strain ATCC 35852 / DSM 46488 / JCM 4925 / NBRC 14057 / NRRL 8057) TaxID=1003195 RepID=G8WX36_STREN|nr:SDR family NAD(P)-dependent oxidoreductase [Streptantibioticus cattleyicolor]AEW95941.1 putative polyketide synthase [Streptantibioticus cattleyicolor NRRL 8057 = DSM 46488]
MSNATQRLDGLKCTVLVRATDPVMRDHTVHGTSILPGVSFLDLIHRILRSKGVPTETAELRRILFKQAVAAGEDFDTELRFLFTAEPGRHRVTVRGVPVFRDGGHGEPADVLECELHLGEAFPVRTVDLAALLARATRTADIGELYRQVRAAGIVHGEFMRGLGTLHVADGELLADLSLSRPARAYLDHFELHPACLDSATLLPTQFAEEVARTLGETAPGDRKPYIPIYIESFRARRRLDGDNRVHARPPRYAGRDADLNRCDLDFYDADGVLQMWLHGLTSKRVRRSALITQLTSVAPASAEEPPAVTAPAPAADGDAGPEGLRRLIRGLLAGHLDTTADQVDPERGFYELGLESTALLAVVKELENALGAELYPTLLFEHNTVESLAAHLHDTVGATLPAAPAPVPAEPETGGAAAPDLLFLAGHWEPADPPAPHPGTTGGVRLVVDPAGRLAGADHAPGTAVTVGHGPAFAEDGTGGYRLDPASPDDWRRLVERLAEEDAVPAEVVWCPAEVTGDGVLEREFTALLHFAAAVLRRPGGRVLRLVYCLPVPDGERGFTPLEALSGMFKSLRLEHPGTRCKLLRLDAVDAGALPGVLAELADDTAVDVAHRAGRRLVRRYRETPAPTGKPVAAPRDGGVYLITGGLGGVGLAFARHLAARHRARLVLCGRSPLDAEGERRIAELTALGAEVLHHRADVADAAQTTALAAAARRRFGRIDGIVHAAGVLRDGMAAGKTAADAGAVLAAKVAGTAHLDRATAEDRLDFFVLCSSTAAAWGNAGQTDYACANAFLDAFAAGRARAVAAGERHGHTVSIGWPAWRDGGMGLTDTAAAALRAMGLEPLDEATGTAVLRAALAAPAPHVVALAGRRADILAAFRQHAAGFQQMALDPAPRATPAAEAAVTREPAPDDDAIAIVGISGRYPMAEDLDRFWENLRTGRDCVTEVPPGRWDHDAIYAPDKGVPGRTYGRWGGFLDGIDEFDPLFFHISPNEAAVIDPQERLFLQTVWHTFEDAGHAPAAWQGRPVGVYVGVMYNQYQLYGVRAPEEPAGLVPSSFNAAIANRVSYFFDLRGPSVALDTMCSSSLTAIHQACESILRGECEAAVAGGVNLSVHPNKYLLLGQSSFLSTDGRCRAFGTGGDGYVPGEGVGAVLLRPLADALRDGDQVYAVIRGRSVNHGGRTGGFSVPNPQAQAQLMVDAFRRSGTDPATVGYVEAHGTGTSLGDPIEVAGLEKAFAELGAGDVRVPVGSVKSNVGHLESAAGIAAVTKVVLQLKHRELVPSLHADDLNPAVDWARSPFHVQRELAPWEPVAPGVPLRAGISSFGAGGANAHLILEGYPAPAGPAAPPPARERLYVFSAKNEDRLRAVVERFLAHLDRHRTGDGRPAAAPTARRLAELLAEVVGVTADPAADETLTGLGLEYPELTAFRQRIEEETGRDLPADVVDGEATLRSLAARLPGPADAAPAPAALDPDAVAHTLRSGRDAMDERLAVVATGLDDLAQRLTGHLAGGTPHGVHRGRRRRSGPWPAERELAGAAERGDLDRLAAAWVIGARSDFTALTPGPRPRRVSLPGYPFERTRCWIAPARPGRATLTELPSGAALFTTDLSTRTQPWLADHVVADRVLLPGTAFVAAVSAAAERLGLGAVAELTLSAPLVLAEEGGTVRLAVTVEAAAENGERRFTVDARPAVADADTPWTRHATGALAPAPAPADAGPAPATWPPSGAEPVAADGFYARLAEAGMAYGPAFQGLRAAWRLGDEVYAEVALASDGAADADAHPVHPALFDAALHAVAHGAFVSAPDRPHLPFSWNGVTLHPAARGATALRVRIAPAGRDAVAVHAWDAAGAPAVTVGSLALRAAADGTERGGGSLFRVEWHEAPAGAVVPPSRCAVLGPDGLGVAAALTAAGAAVEAYDDLTAVTGRPPGAGLRPRRTARRRRRPGRRRAHRHPAGAGAAACLAGRTALRREPPGVRHAWCGGGGW